MISEALVLAGLLCMACAQYCDNNAITECSRPLSKYDLGPEDAAENLKKAFPLARFSSEEIKDICRIYDDVHACMRPYISECGDVVELTYKGANSALEYICQEGFQDFLDSKSCFLSQEQELSDGWGDCLQSYKDRLGHYDAESQWCKYTGLYEECVKDMVSRECGKDAAKFADIYNHKAMAPASNVANCGGLSTTVITVIAVGIVFVLCVCSVIFRHWLRQRRAQPSTGTDSTTNVPYSNFQTSPDYQYGPNQGQGQGQGVTGMYPGQMPQQYAPVNAGFPPGGGATYPPQYTQVENKPPPQAVAV